jgi:hypothetical protein
VTEVLVALSIVTVLAGAALAVALSSRGVYTTDLNRTTLNQNLRIGMDLVGVDVRQAGQQLPEDVPAIQIVDGGAGGTDTLILRRNLLPFVLPVCRNVKKATADDAVFIAVKMKKPPLGCSPVPDSNGDKWPDNLEAWREYRIDHGGEVTAYIYNPVRTVGEFFIYDDEDNSTFHVHRANPGRWANDYPVDEQSRIYILEQKTFEVVGDVLQYYLNNDRDNARKLIYAVTDFQSVAHMRDGTVQTAWAGERWSGLESIGVSLQGEMAFQGRAMRRTLDARFFPRNVLSL